MTQPNDAAERWRATNAQARARGCRCGKPATHVRYFGGTIGGVPMEYWTCADHVNVGQWYVNGDGTGTPGEDFTPEVLAWEVSPGAHWRHPEAPVVSHVPHDRRSSGIPEPTPPAARWTPRNIIGALTRRRRRRDPDGRVDAP